jgi:hypothetical protein
MRWLVGSTPRLSGLAVVRQVARRSSRSGLAGVGGARGAARRHEVGDVGGREAPGDVPHHAPGLAIRLAWGGKRREEKRMEGNRREWKRVDREQTESRQRADREQTESRQRENGRRPGVVRPRVLGREAVHRSGRAPLHSRGESRQTTGRPRAASCRSCASLPAVDSRCRGVGGYGNETARRRAAYFGIWPEKVASLALQRGCPPRCLKQRCQPLSSSVSSCAQMMLGMSDRHGSSDRNWVSSLI